MSTQPTMGPCIDSYEIEEAMLTVLRERLPTYVDARARRLGIDPVADGLRIRPKTLCRRSPFAGFPKTELPLIEVVSGEAGSAEKGNNGLLVETWAVNVVVYVAARDYESTRRLRAVWESAIPWCVLQAQTLGGIAMAIDLVGRGVDDNVDGDAHRTLQGAECAFAVTIPNVLDPLAGPVTFIPDDPEDPDFPGEYDGGVIPESVSIELEPMP